MSGAERRITRPPALDRIREQFPVTTRASVEQLTKNAMSALERPLKRLGLSSKHGQAGAIAGGGPSLADSFEALRGVTTLACNGAHDFLLERGIVPYGCVVCDPSPRLAKMITPHEEVFYFIASTAAPELFDRLAGNTVVIWHPSGHPALDQLYAARSLFTVGGGSTVGMRAIDLAYVMGFRNLDLHGFDSSFRQTTHAYRDEGDHEVMTMCGFETSPAFIAQIDDFFERMPNLPDLRFRLMGTGLLQYLCDPAAYPAMTGVAA